MSTTEFAGYAVAEITKNFLFTYGPPLSTGQEDAEAYHRARSIAQTCEADLATLEGLFACSFQAGGRNHYSTWVHVPTSDGSGDVSNRGWARDESSQILIGRTVSATGPTPGTLNVYEEFARMLFVAELAEILMDFSPFGWDRRGSDGEALSIVLATELHPVGYYQSGKGGPRVNTWLRSDRHDWVTDTERTDSDWNSFGCGVLFINYLRHQLGHSLEQIIRTGRGPYLTRVLAPTLAQRFDELTGAGANWAFPGFATLVEEHVPSGSGIWVASDNIFPLRPASTRTVTLSATSVPIGSTRGPVEKIKVKAGFICEESEYDLWRTSDVTELDVAAFGHGFAASTIAWSVNGVPLPTRGTKAGVNVSVRPTIDNPDGTQTEVGERTIGLIYVVNDAWNKSNLALRNTSSVGNYDLELTAAATEIALSSPGTTVHSITMTMTEVSYEVEGRYYADRRRCNPQFSAVGRALSDLVRVLGLFKNAPDPAPELYVDRIVEGAEQVTRHLAAAADAQQVSLESVRRELTSPVAVGQMLAAAHQLTDLPELEAVRELTLRKP